MQPFQEVSLKPPPPCSCLSPPSSPKKGSVWRKAAAACLEQLFLPPPTMHVMGSLPGQPCKNNEMLGSSGAAPLSLVFCVVFFFCMAQKVCSPRSSAYKPAAMPCVWEFSCAGMQCSRQQPQPPCHQAHAPPPCLSMRSYIRLGKAATHKHAEHSPWMRW